MRLMARRDLTITKGKPVLTTPLNFLRSPWDIRWQQHLSINPYITHPVLPRPVWILENWAQPCQFVLPKTLRLIFFFISFVRSFVCFYGPPVTLYYRPYHLLLLVFFPIQLHKSSFIIQSGPATVEEFTIMDLLLVCCWHCLLFVCLFVVLVWWKRLSNWA